MTYVFLSDEWIEAARTLLDEYDGRIPPIAHVVRANLVVNEAPFDDGERLAHLNTDSGQLLIELGHIETADLFVTVDYPTAKALLVDGNPQAAMQAFMAGKIRIEGDVAKLMVLAQMPMDEAAIDYGNRLRAMTI